LAHADFTKANLSYVNFSHANAKNARFVKCECFETIFYKTDLTHAKLVNSLFVEADFREATLKHVDVSVSVFEDVLIKGAKLTDIRGIDNAYIKSINIGTPENPIMLEGDKAKEWLMNHLV
jgi:uncharacterized protein YjbI with pentapeptide repeats